MVDVTGAAVAIGIDTMPAIARSASSARIGLPIHLRWLLSRRVATEACELVCNVVAMAGISSSDSDCNRCAADMVVRTWRRFSAHPVFIDGASAAI